MSLATGHESGPTPSGGAPPQPAPGAPRRGRPLWWVAAGLLAFLALGAALFVRQAIDRQRVETDLDLAAAAFAAARRADARELAPDEWLLATTRIDEAMAELHRQDGRLVLVRAYPRVHELLAEAIDAADAAKAAADPAGKPAGLATATTDVARQEPGPAASTGTPSRGDVHNQTKEAVESESYKAWNLPDAATAQRRARAAIDAAKVALRHSSELLTLIERCPDARHDKEVRKDLEVVAANIDSTRSQLGALETASTRNELLNAKVSADRLKAQLDSLSKALEGISTKFKCR